MAEPEDNLFLRLHKWAARQDENFCTEALVFLVQRLLDHQPEVGIRLLCRITDGFLAIPPEQADRVELATQVVTTEGRPDWTIQWADHLVVVEVKVESELHEKQLDDYRAFLDKSGFKHTRLGLLTRYPPPKIAESSERPDFGIRWYQVAEWVEKELGDKTISESATFYLCSQFVRFLGERNMAIEKVTCHLADGVRALSNLLHMLLEVATSCTLSPQRSAGWDYGGVKFNKYWVGMVFTEPARLCFRSWVPIDSQATALVESGEVILGKSRDDWTWQRVADLDSERIHFFARSKESQVKWLESFLRESLDIARRIETPDQAATPEKPEGN